MKIGIGQNVHRDGRKAGSLATTDALGGLRGSRPDLLLVFATAGYEQNAILEGVYEASGAAQIVGCSTSGVIAGNNCTEATYAVGVMAIASPSLHFEAFRESKLFEEPADCAKRLAKAIREKCITGKGLLLVLPDGLNGNISLFLDVLDLELPQAIRVAGGTAGELLKTDQTWQYLGQSALSDSVSALLIQGDFEAEVAVSHGCDVIGLEQTITGASNGWVYEIDGQSAWNRYKEYLEINDIDTLTMSHFCYICLAKLLSDPDPIYGSHVIRCPLKVDRKQGALFFPGNLEVGSRVRMALRNPEGALKRACDSAREIERRHPGESPLFVLQFDCCCRGRLMFGEREQAYIRTIHETLGAKIPWFGFQTYGEIANLNGNRAKFHNYSSVLCAVYSAESGLGQRG